jgi:hypothetical protein
MGNDENETITKILANMSRYRAATTSTGYMQALRTYRDTDAVGTAREKPEREMERLWAIQDQKKQ